MKRHELTEMELDDWTRTAWFQFAASVGEDSNKRLEVSLGGLYRVTDHGAVKYIGGVKLTAISEYNALR